MMDLTKLTPAPWHDEDDYVFEEHGVCVAELRMRSVGEESSATDAAFIALARNAFDVTIRRGWTAHLLFNNCWGVLQGKQGWPTAGDPFTALVEADAWYKANVEKPC